MHKTGNYKFINLTFGIFPSIAAILIATMNENSSSVRLWLSIVRKAAPRIILQDSDALLQIPFGFGNGIVLQTMHSESPRRDCRLILTRFSVALLANIPRKSGSFVFQNPIA